MTRAMVDLQRDFTKAHRIPFRKPLVGLHRLTAKAEHLRLLRDQVQPEFVAPMRTDDR